MSTPTVIIHNAETNEIIEREMNSSELAQFAIDAQREETRNQEILAKEIARQAVLDRLGITIEEAQLILGGSN